jgi:uncharacterized membrane protein YhaH (DUF805 family)
VIRWYVEVLKKYAVFNGRARRSEYWYFALGNFIIIFPLTLIITAIGDGGAETIANALAIVYLLYILAIFLPSLAVNVRRLHDTGRSGWWVLFKLVPFVGVLVVFIFEVLDSDPGDNRYGPNPKTESAGLQAT